MTAPVYTYNHSAQVVSGESCPTGSSSTAGLAFYTGGSYPSSYVNALFFADYSRQCIWAMLPGTNGVPESEQPPDLRGRRRGARAAGDADPVAIFSTWI